MTVDEFVVADGRRLPKARIENLLVRRQCVLCCNVSYDVMIANVI